jgi:DNA transformation protein and related proteins
VATQKDTIAHILESLNGQERLFTARAMFGEYALYCNGKVVALVCEDTLFVKIVPASSALEDVCEQASAYPGSKPYYVVEESDVARVEGLSDILVCIAESLPVPKAKSQIKK